MHSKCFGFFCSSFFHFSAKRLCHFEKVQLYDSAGDLFICSVILFICTVDSVNTGFLVKKLVEDPWMLWE
jgi:hypothetical protein